MMNTIARTTKDIGNVLRNVRKAKGLTQTELASRAGVWQRTISNIETSASEARLDTVFDLLAALDLEFRIVPRSKMKPGDLEDIF